MIQYNANLKSFARKLRKDLTPAESLLWSFIKRRNILNTQFYRQIIIEDFIVDFYAPQIKLVIEVDGSQHYDPAHFYKDKKRDAYFKSIGITVLRYSNAQVLLSTKDVLENLWFVINELLCGRAYTRED